MDVLLTAVVRLASLPIICGPEECKALMSSFVVVCLCPEKHCASFVSVRDVLRGGSLIMDKVDGVADVPLSLPGLRANPRTTTFMALFAWRLHGPVLYV